MSLTIAIRDHMRVVGSDGNYVGTVENVDGDEIRLTRGHPKAGAQHHWLPLDWIEYVDDAVHLNLDSNQAHREWKPVPAYTEG